MPNNQPNRPAIRAAGHSIRCYASPIVLAPIVSGTVSVTPPYPSGQNGNVVNVTYVVGAYTDVDFGMEVAFFDTATGAFKARTHIRYGVLAANALNIFVREFAQATMNLVAGDTFRIYPEWRLHDKLVAATSAFPPDFRFMTTENDEPEPVVNSGGDWAGMVDGYGTASELSYATVQMTGDTSFTVYPTGGTVNHLWTLPAGVTFAPGSSSTDANPVLRVPVGTYTITHEGEDDATGSTRLSHPSIRVHNDADPPYRVIVTSYEGAADSGWNWEVEVLSGDVSLSAIPDGCKVILWGRERYNGDWQSFRNASPGRSHILGVGYAARDISSGSGEDGAHRLSFEVLSPLERLKQIKSYSKVMLEDANPDAWSEIYILGVLRGILQIKQYYLMWNEAGFDTVVDPDFLDERYPAHFLDATNFYDQMMEMAKAVDARIVVDRTGRMDIHTHPANIPLPDRAAVTVALELEDADILDYEWTREHFPKVAQMKVSGISGGTANNVPVFSLYPGQAAGEALDAPEIARLILDESAPQADINSRAGRYGALADMVFYDEDGIRHNAFDLRLKLRGAYDVFDFYKEYIKVVITQNQRSIDLTDRRFYLLSSSTGFDPDYGTTTTDLVLRMETNAADGETFVPPPDNSVPPSDFPPTAPITPPTPFPGGVDRTQADMALIAINGIFLTADFQTPAVAGGPTWALDQLPWGGTLVGWCPRGGTNPAAGWIVTTTEVGYYVFETGVYTVKHTFADVTAKRSLDAAFRADDIHFVVSSYIDGVGGKILYTTDNSTFTEVANGTNSPSDDTLYGIAPGCFVSTRVAGRVYTSRFTNDSDIGTGNATSAGRQSADYGATTSALSMQNSGYLAQHIHVPWHDNASDAIYYYGALVGAAASTNSQRLYRNGVDISPSVGGDKYGPRRRDGMGTSVSNRQRMVACLQGGVASDYALFLSNNAGAAAPTWTVIAAPGTDFRRVALSGNDPNRAWAWGVNEAISQLTITGNTVALDDRSGNLASLSPGEIIAIAGV